jgi:hypothetical protein
MTREKVEDLRERLLRDEQVQRLIRMRAYEIYRQRGGGHGSPAEDWVRAETEVLAYVIEEETRRRSQGGEEPVAPPMNEERAEGPRTLDTIHTPESTERASEPDAQTSEERAQSQSIMGTWSAAEPPSATLAPELGRATEKARTGKARSSSKPSATKRAKAAEGEPEAKAPKKSAVSKSGAAKRPASKKSGGGPKGKRAEDE